MGDGNEYRAGNGEHGIRARAARGKLAGFAASAEFGPFLYPRQIESSEETMELTLPPGRHETIEKQYPAGHDYCHQMAVLAQRGSPAWLALRTLR
jgi:hypothetical protein